MLQATSKRHLPQPLCCRPRLVRTTKQPSLKSNPCALPDPQQPLFLPFLTQNPRPAPTGGCPSLPGHPQPAAARRAGGHQKFPAGQLSRLPPSLSPSLLLLLFASVPSPFPSSAGRRRFPDTSSPVPPPAPRPAADKAPGPPLPARHSAHGPAAT